MSKQSRQEIAYEAREARVATTKGKLERRHRIDSAIKAGYREALAIAESARGPGAVPKQHDVALAVRAALEANGIRLVCTERKEAR